MVNTDEDLKYLYDVKSQPATQHLDNRQKKGEGGVFKDTNEPYPNLYI